MRVSSAVIGLLTGPLNLQSGSTWGSSNDRSIGASCATTAMSADLALLAAATTARTHTARTHFSAAAVRLPSANLRNSYTVTPTTHEYKKTEAVREILSIKLLRGCSF